MVRLKPDPTIELDLHPDSRRGDLRRRGTARIGTARSFETADRAHRHVVIAEDLAGQAHAGQTFRRETLDLGRCMCRRLAVDELDAAGRATRVSAARMENVNLGILLDGEHEPLSVRDLERSVSFDRQLWHPSIVGQPFTTMPFLVRQSRTRSRKSPCNSIAPSATAPPVPQARFNS